MIFTYRKGFHVEQYRIAVGFSRSLAVGFKKTWKFKQPDEAYQDILQSIGTITI